MELKKQFIEVFTHAGLDSAGAKSLADVVFDGAETDKLQISYHALDDSYFSSFAKRFLEELHLPSLNRLLGLLLQLKEYDALVTLASAYYAPSFLSKSYESIKENYTYFERSFDKLMQMFKYFNYETSEILPFVSRQVFYEGSLKRPAEEYLQKLWQQNQKLIVQYIKKDPVKNAVLFWHDQDASAAEYFLVSETLNGAVRFLGLIVRLKIDVEALFVPHLASGKGKIKNTVIRVLNALKMGDIVRQKLNLMLETATVQKLVLEGQPRKELFDGPYTDAIIGAQSAAVFMRNLLRQYLIVGNSLDVQKAKDYFGCKIQEEALFVLEKMQKEKAALQNAHLALFSCFADPWYIETFLQEAKVRDDKKKKLLIRYASLFPETAIRYCLKHKIPYCDVQRHAIRALRAEEKNFSKFDYLFMELSQSTGKKTTAAKNLLRELYFEFNFMNYSTFKNCILYMPEVKKLAEQLVFGAYKGKKLYAAFIVSNTEIKILEGADFTATPESFRYCLVDSSEVNTFKYAGLITKSFLNQIFKTGFKLPDSAYFATAYRGLNAATVFNIAKLIRLLRRHNDLIYNAKGEIKGVYKILKDEDLVACSFFKKPIHKQTEQTEIAEIRFIPESSFLKLGHSIFLDKMQAVPLSSVRPRLLSRYIEDISDCIKISNI